MKRSCQLQHSPQTRATAKKPVGELVGAPLSHARHVYDFFLSALTCHNHREMHSAIRKAAKTCPKSPDQQTSSTIINNVQRV